MQENVLESVLTINKVSIPDEVTFNRTDGTVVPTSKNMNFNEEYEELPTSSQAGNTFSGWYTSTSA